MTSHKYPVFFMNEAIRAAVLNPQGSKIFLKKIVNVSVAYILHQRTDFDRSSFETKTRNGVPYKVFKGKLFHPLLTQVKDWIKGAFDALDKNYLRELYLIFCSEEDPTKVYESYKFQFQYLGNDAIPLGRSPTQKELTHSTDTLLKAIGSLDQLEQLKSDKITVKMALTYYEDVTPAHYDPPCYDSPDDGAQSIMASVSSHSKCYFNLGMLSTGFDIVKCRAKGAIFNMNQIPSNSTSNLLDEDLNNLDVEKSTMVDNETQTETAESALPNDQIKTEHPALNTSDISQSTEDDIISISDEDEDFDMMSKIIRCVCQFTTEFPHIALVLCTGCLYLQHTVCIGYLSAKDVPDPYLCQVCKKYDKRLTLAQKISEREISVYRLIIGYAYFNNEFLEEVFVELSSEFHTQLKQKLKSLQIISENDGKFIVNVQLIEKKFLKPWFPLSFIPDSADLMDSSSQDDSLIYEEPGRKKIKYIRLS